VSAQNISTILIQNARFLWLAALFLPPLAAFAVYELTPHERLWHEVVYSLICLPLFAVWLIALFGCVFSFLSHRATAD
jgi:hypothetical protein